MLRLKALLDRLRGIGWTIKIIPRLKQEASVIHLNGLDALRFGFVVCSLFLVVFSYLVLRGSQERASLRTLSRSLQAEHAQLKKIENQKAEMQNLLSQKTGQLENHLLEMRRQEAELQKLLHGKGRTGMIPGSPVAWSSVSAAGRMRFAQRSSRGGSYDQLVTRLSALERQIGLEESILTRVKGLAWIRHQQLEKERQKLASVFKRIPSLWPTLGEVTSGFGYRRQPVDGEGEFHSGVDVATVYASPIQATAGGTCISAEYKNGYGLTVLIDHGNGLITQYSHCSRILTRVGSVLRKGETIALVGMTGFATGPHVHYEVHYHNTPINPAGFLGLTLDEFIDEGGIPKLVSKR